MGVKASPCIRDAEQATQGPWLRTREMTHHTLSRSLVGFCAPPCEYVLFQRWERGELEGPRLTASRARVHSMCC